MLDPIHQPEQLIGLSSGRYEILPVQKQGDLTVYYGASDIQVQREVTLKLPAPDVLHNRGRRAYALPRFAGVLRLRLRLDHQRVLPLFDAGSITDMPHTLIVAPLFAAAERFTGTQDTVATDG